MYGRQHQTDRPVTQKKKHIEQNTNKQNLEGSASLPHGAKGRSFCSVQITEKKRDNRNAPTLGGKDTSLSAYAQAFLLKSWTAHNDIAALGRSVIRSDCNHLYIYSITRKHELTPRGARTVLQVKYVTLHLRFSKIRRESKELVNRTVRT